MIKYLIIFFGLWINLTYPLSGQTEAKPAVTEVKKDSPFPEAKEEKVLMPKELVEKIKLENEQAVKRIDEIEKAVYPIQEELAQKFFGLEKGEYTFLRKQAQTPQTGVQYFEKLKNLESDSLDTIADYFDEAFSALEAGDYWVGREQTLIRDDAALFAELQNKVVAEMAKRPDGEKLTKMLSERETLLGKLKTSLPLYRYFSERRMWWDNHPGYQKAVSEDAVPAVPRPE